jgi:MFS family permease
MHTWWQFYIFFGLLVGVGLGATGWVPNVTIILLWFREKRGLAIGIISSGIGIGMLFCVPFVQHLILRLGWRMAYRVMAIFIPLLIILMAIVFFRRPPHSTPDHAETGVTSRFIKDPLDGDEQSMSRDWTLQRAISTKVFWFLGLSFFLANFMTQSIFAHQVAFFVDRGLAALLASYIVGIIGGVSLGSKILWGVLSDKIGREITYTIGITFFIFGMLLLILFNMFPNTSLLYFYAFFFSMGYAVTTALPALIAADCFEGKGYGGIFGTLMIFIGIGGALGAWFAGFLYDQVGSYIPFFIIAQTCALVSCLTIWVAAPRKIRVVPGGKVSQ